jgi:hypothetical protein
MINTFLFTLISSLAVFYLSYLIEPFLVAATFKFRLQKNICKLESQSETYYPLS